jgi:hypothetical protein
MHLTDVQGWSSQVGLGARNGDPDASTWNVTNPRPDLDLSAPRSPAELGPNAKLHIEVPIKWSAPDPLSLIPSGIRGIIKNIDISVEMTPTIEADFASQLDLIARDVRYENCSRQGEISVYPCNLSEVVMPMQLSTTGRLDLSGILHLHIYFQHIPFVNDIGVDPGFTIPLSKGSATSPEGYSEDDPYVRSKGPQILRNVARASRISDVPGGSTGDLVTTITGSSWNDLEGYRKHCLTSEKISSSPPPAPTHHPFSSSIGLEYAPCNVCVAPADQDHTSYNPFLLWRVNNQSYSSSKEWLCRAKANSGCFDLCTFDKKSGAFLSAARSAVDLVGKVCLQDPAPPAPK